MAFQPILDGSNAPILVDGRERPIGQKLRQWLQGVINNHQNAGAALALGHNIAIPTYGPTIKIDLSQGGVQKIVVTNGTAFTISAPVNITQLATWELVIVNASGGTMGAVTFAASIHQSGFTAPASGKRKGVLFYIEPGSTPEHYQLGTWGPAV